MPNKNISARDGPRAAAPRISGAVLRLTRDEVRELVEKYEQGSGADIDSDSQQLLLRYFAENAASPEDQELSRRLDDALKAAVRPS